MVWPNSYWSSRNIDPLEKEWSQVVLLSCKVEHVERVFHHICRDAPKPPQVPLASANQLKDVVIHHGILMGREDVFCIISSSFVEHLHKFVKHISGYAS
jgi:hypothetical protein